MLSRDMYNNNNTNNRKKGYEITQEWIDVINTAVEYLHKWNELENLCNDYFLVIILDNATTFPWVCKIFWKMTFGLKNVLKK